MDRTEENPGAPVLRSPEGEGEPVLPPVRRSPQGEGGSPQGEGGSPEGEGGSPQGERGSQSKLPTAFLLVVLAALLFRVVTGLVGREKKEADAGAGLVHWLSPAAASAGASRGKPVLYDFTAAWCPPCHRLDAEGWGDAKIAAIVDESFLPVRIVDRAREEGRNPRAIEELQRRYSIVAFPTLVVADGDGRSIARAEGYRGREALVTFLQEAGEKARGKP